MPVFTDQLGNKIVLNAPPKRIVSLVPSQTELLYDLGLRDEVVGITKFCIHPNEWFKTKTRVGGTKQLNFKAIQSLQPDLIIGNKEENEQADIEQLFKLSITSEAGAYTAPVWMSDIKNLHDALDMIVKLGTLVSKQQQAILLKLQIEAAFRELEQFIEGNSKLQTSNFKPPKVSYFIWQQPYMVAGNDTFINDMLAKCGLQNVFANQAGRYPEVTLAQLQEADPDVILLSSEPYPFKQQNLEAFNTACPNAKVVLVDGELFSWYGSRLLHSPAYFKHLLNQIVK